MNRYFVNKSEELVPGARVNVDQNLWKGVVSNMVYNITHNMPPTLDNCNGGLYTGAAGVCYMFYHMACSDPFKDQREDLLAKARDYLEVCLGYSQSERNRNPPASLLVGNAGVYAVASLIFNEMGDKKMLKDMTTRYQALGSACQPRDYLGCGSDEYLIGRAGYLCGAAVLNKKLKQQVVSADTSNMLCKVTVESGRDYSSKHKSNSPLMYAYHRTEVLGAAHGLSSILQFLLYFPDFLKSNPAMEQDIHNAVDFMLSIMQSNGNTAPAMDEVTAQHQRSDELLHWCHGAPGIIYLFAKAWHIWHDDKYLQACYRCGEITWQKGLLRKGPGICHGVAGNGYVFLLLYRLTADEKHLHRALKFAEFMQTDEFANGASTPDSPYSLYEGLAGTVCFLTDLMQPQKAEFPFFDVF